MLKILGKERKSRDVTVADISEASMVEAFEAVDDDDLSSWEFINQSDDDDVDEDYSYDEDDLLDVECKDLNSFGSPSSDISMPSLSDKLKHHHQYTNGHDVDVDDDDDVVRDESDGEECDEDEDEDDDEDEYDLDDELVPNWMSDRFGRQRMRKLGKRADQKMYKSKRVPYYYNRPGCVHGKHGLGLKA